MGDETPIARATESTKETDFFEEISGWRVSQYGKFGIELLEWCAHKRVLYGPGFEITIFFSSSFNFTS